MKDYLVFLYDAGRGRVGKWWLTFIFFIALSISVYFFGYQINFLSAESLAIYLIALFLMANLEFFFFRKR